MQGSITLGKEITGKVTAGAPLYYFYRPAHLQPLPSSLTIRVQTITVTPPPARAIPNTAATTAGSDAIVGEADVYVSQSAHQPSRSNYLACNQVQAVIGSNYVM